MSRDSDIAKEIGGEGAAGDPAGTAVPGNPATHRAASGRWLMWAVLAACYLMVVFQRIAPGVVADRLMADFAVGGAVVGMLTAIYFYMYAIMQIPSGALADGLGPRYTVTVGAVLAGLGSLVFGMSQTLEMAYLGRLLVGLGVSVVFVATLKFQASWFRAVEFGTVSGLLMVVGNLGAVTGTTPVAVMAQLLGWRLSFVLIGLATCALAIAVWRWVRDSPRAAGTPSRHTAAAPPAGFLSGAATVWRNRQTWTGFLAHFGLVGAYLTFSGLWAVPYLMHVYGMERFQAANYLLAASLGMLVSAPLAGYVSDKVVAGRRLPILSMAVVSCGCWLALTLWNGGKPPVWALYPLFALLGFAGGNVGLILTSVKEASPPALGGLAMGTANSGFLCAAVLQPAIGYLLDGYWRGEMLAGARVYPAAGYQIVLIVLTSFAILGLLGALSMRETLRGNR